MNTPLQIMQFTDPACPFAYSAEPSRWRLKWLYGDQLIWHIKMIVLSGYDSETSPMTPLRISRSRVNLREQHGMPMDDTELPHVPDSVLSCSAVVAARRHRPELAEAVLRNIRVAIMSGKLADEQQVLNECLSQAGLDPAEVAGWMKEADTKAELSQDAETARNPGAQAQNMQHKLSKTSTGRIRYSAPSYIFADGDNILFELPGFWPLEAYESAIGNFLENAERKADPKTVSEVLEWAGTPLATVEIAKICNMNIEQTRLQLEKVAVFSPVGQDGFWNLSS